MRRPGHPKVWGAGQDRLSLRRLRRSAPLPRPVPVHRAPADFHFSAAAINNDPRAAPFHMFSHADSDDRSDCRTAFQRRSVLGCRALPWRPSLAFEPGFSFHNETSGSAMTQPVSQAKQAKAKADAVGQARALAPEVPARIGSTPATKFRGNPEIFGRLVEDHDKHRALLAMIEATAPNDPARKALFEEFVRDVHGHAAAEEQALWSTVMRNPEITEFARHAVGDHHKLDKLMADRGARHHLIGLADPFRHAEGRVPRAHSRGGDRAVSGGRKGPVGSGPALHAEGLRASEEGRKGRGRDREEDRLEAGGIGHMSGATIKRDLTPSTLNPAG